MPTAVRTIKFVPKPAAPEADPRFQNVKGKIGQKAAQIKKHPPAKLKAAEAAKAAKAPPNAKQAEAQEKQTDLMKAAKAEKIEPESFRTVLRAEIKKVMPETLDDADNFMEGGKQEEMIGAVSGKIGEQKSNAEAQIKTTTKQKPNTAGIPEKEVKDLPPVPPTPVPVIEAAEALPVPRTDEEISQQSSKRDADRQLKDAQVTTKQLKKADDPRFTAVLDAKREVEQTVDASPAKYRAKEKIMLGQIAVKAQSDGRRNLFALAVVKIKSGAAVRSRQSAAQAKDEKARKEVADNIEAMYNATRMSVETRLSSLETTVFSMFDNGSAAAIAQMKSDTEREIDDFTDKRYSGIGGKLDWIADRFRATPEGIVKIINRNLQIFRAAMDALVDRVADTVDALLKQATAEIDKGQAKIKGYVSTLKGSLSNVGKAAEKEIAGRFDEMRDGVEERKNALAQKLAESYKSAIDKGNALASELEAENAGGAYKLAKKLAEIAQIILDFKDKLVAILKKAVSVILDILSDPIGFFGNLIEALRQGFSQFKDNFAKNFKEAIATWLLGNLGGSGFELPKDLSVPSILKLVMGVAGLTYERIRAKAAALIGERNVALLEKLYDYLKILFTGGAGELWAEVKKDFGNLEETVIGGIKSWLMTALVEAGIKKLLTMFIPGGGFVQAALAIYKIVVFIVERAAQIADFISSIVDSVADIVSGAIGAAASRIEKALVQALALIIDLLARIIGLSGIAETIKSIIKKVKAPIEKAIDFVIARVVQTVKKLFGRSGKKADEQAEDGKDGVFKEKFSMGREGHTITATLKGKALTITMASGDDLLLSVQLSTAISEVQQDTKREDSEKKAILSQLSRAKILVDFIRTDYVQAGRTVPFDKFMKPRLAKITGNLSILAKYKPPIESLQHIISIGKPRFIPKVKIDIRRRLYDDTTGGKWKELSKKLRESYKQKLRPKLYAIWQQRDDKSDPKNYKEAESKWNLLKDKEEIPVKEAPTFASYDHPKHFDKFKYETDHKVSLGVFWKAGEKNSDDETRSKTTLDESNLQVLTKEKNSKKGGIKFDRDVGPNFSSKVNHSPLNSKTIKGIPFEEE